MTTFLDKFVSFHLINVFCFVFTLTCKQVTDGRGRGGTHVFFSLFIFRGHNWSSPSGIKAGGSDSLCYCAIVRLCVTSLKIQIGSKFSISLQVGSSSSRSPSTVNYQCCFILNPEFFSSLFSNPCNIYDENMHYVSHGLILPHFFRNATQPVNEISQHYQLVYPKCVPEQYRLNLIPQKWFRTITLIMFLLSSICLCVI